MIRLSPNGPRAAEGERSDADRDHGDVSVSCAMAGSRESFWIAAGRQEHLTTTGAALYEHEQDD